MREPATDEQITEIAVTVLKSYPTHGITLKDLRIITCELVRDDYKLDRSRVAMIVATMPKTEVKGKREAMYHEAGWVMPVKRDDQDVPKEVEYTHAPTAWQRRVYGGVRGDR